MTRHSAVLLLIGAIVGAACGGAATPAATPAPTVAATPAPTVAATAAPTKAADTSKYAAIPAGKDNDLRIFTTDGKVVKGAEALERMPKDAQLILWLAGNQFFAMEDVIRAFQKTESKTSVGLITLPPGLLLKGIQGGGVTYGGKAYAITPDVYSSVAVAHLQTLKKEDRMEQYAIHMHNELEIMVAKGNPKGIKGIKDLARPDVRTSMPNPVTEGIMVEYARKVLERHGIWQTISAGKICESCQTTPNNWFTAVHHRETPDRIKAGTSDAGIVWKTETLEALRDGAQVDAVSLPPEDSLRSEVNYAIGPLKGAKNSAAAMKYMAFLATPECQAAYGKYGFVNATAEELKLKSIP